MEPVSDWVTASTESSNLPPGHLVVNRAFAPRLTTAFTRTFETAATFGEAVEERITAELIEPAPNALGMDGLAPVGTKVRGGDVLIGMVRALRRRRNQRPDYPTGQAMGPIDISIRCPPGGEGQVVEAELIPRRKRGDRSQARIVVKFERPLRIGDRLRDASGREATVAAIADITADLGWADAPASVRVAKLETALDAVTARGREDHPVAAAMADDDPPDALGQSFEDAHTLAEAGAEWLLTELMTIKSGHPDRDRILDAIEADRIPRLFGDGDPANTDGQALTPPLVAALRAELAAAGIHVDLERERLAARLMTAEEIRQTSMGHVRQGATIDMVTHVPEPDGLMCARIFGSTENDRRRRFGHVEFCVPVIHPWFIDEVAILLGLTKSDVHRICHAEAALKDGEVIELDRAPKRATTSTLIAEALAKVDLTQASTEGTAAQRTLAEKMRAQGYLASSFALTMLPVLPAGLRPMVPRRGFSVFRMADLTSYYCPVVNRSFRLRRLLELDAPTVILVSETRSMFAAMEALFQNELCESPAAYDSRIITSLLGTIRRRCAEILSKGVDFSGRAPVTVDPELTPGSCRLPLRIAQVIFHGTLDGYAGKIVLVGTGVAAREAKVWNEWAIAVDPTTAQALGPYASVHVPLTAEARAECERLSDFVPQRPAERPDGWFLRLLYGTEPVVEVLKSAVLNGLEQQVEQPLRAVLGRAPKISPARS